MHIEVHVSEYVYVCVCSCVFLYASACFRLLVSPIIIYQLCVTGNVQRGSIYKYFISASIFFHSICEITNLANYNALLPLLDLLLS